MTRRISTTVPAVMAVAAIVLACLQPAGGAEITIVNPGFESVYTGVSASEVLTVGDALAEGGASSEWTDGMGSTNLHWAGVTAYVPGWVTQASDEGAGVYNPGPQHLPGGLAAEGNYCAYSNGGTLTQTLEGVTLQANTTYVLTAYVGDRLDVTTFPSCGIYLQAGGVNVGGSGSGDSPLPADGWVQWSRTLDIGETCMVGETNLVGQALGIMAFANTGQVNFDNFRLTTEPFAGVPTGQQQEQGTSSMMAEQMTSFEMVGTEAIVPEPATALLLAAGLALPSIRRWRRRRSR
jgi:hypothetical protein